MPTTFKDGAGREWSIRFTATRLTRLRELLGFSVLLAPTPDGGAEWKGVDVVRDQFRFFDVLGVLLADQFDSTGVARSSFFDELDDATYRAAADAFVGACLNFSLDPAAALRTLRGEGGEPSGRDPSTSNNGPTNSPAPPESTPATTASGP